MCSGAFVAPLPGPPTGSNFQVRLDNVTRAKPDAPRRRNASYALLANELRGYHRGLKQTNWPSGSGQRTARLPISKPPTAAITAAILIISPGTKDVSPAASVPLHPRRSR